MLCYLVKLDVSNHNYNDTEFKIVTKFEDALDFIAQGSAIPTLNMKKVDGNIWNVHWSVSKQVGDVFTVKYGIASILRLDHW